jgi:hypothetical protein
MRVFTGVLGAGAIFLGFGVLRDWRGLRGGGRRGWCEE